MMMIYKSEKTKVLKAIEKATGIKCDITGMGWNEHNDDPLLDGSFVEAKLECCDSKTGRFVGYVILQIVLFDRRRSWVSGVLA